MSEDTRRPRVLFWAAAVCFAVVCAASAPPSLAAVGGKLVLVGVNLDAADDAQAGLYVMNADGSGRRQLTHNPGDEQPHWSPDGRSIAFVRDIGVGGRVMLMRADGTALRRVGSSSNGLDAPTPWSPDGKRIAWSGCGGLCIYNVTSSRRAAVSLGSDDTEGFAWSPDGRTLAAVDHANRLVVVSTAGRILEVLSAAGQFPAWSPDGKQIAFLRRLAWAYALEVVPAAGGRTRVVARNADSGPTWSRDGRRLLYTELVRRPFGKSIGVVNVVAHTNTRIENDAGIARWSADGAAIVYGRLPFPGAPGQDLWIVRPDGSRRRRLTDEFPTGLSYSDLDATSGRVPGGKAASPPGLLRLQVASELKLDSLDSISRAATPTGVVYRADRLCNEDAETFSMTLNVWTPADGRTVTTSTPCQDWEPESYAATSTLDVWISPSDLNGNETLAAMRPGTREAPPIAQWTSGEETPDIGWRQRIGEPLASDSTIVFETDTSDGTTQLWRIVDGTVPHAVQIPLPSDGSDLLDADAGRIVVRTTHHSIAVLGIDGVVLSRIPVSGAVRIGGDVLGAATGNTLRIYDPRSGALRYQLPLAHAAGHPRLLAVGAGYAVYASGIELHLLRLDNRSDRIADLPGQAGPLQALLTPNGLFVAYWHGYDPKPARILFVPAAGLP